VNLPASTIVTDEHRRAELLEAADVLPCAQCGADVWAADLVIVETLERSWALPQSDVDAMNDELEAQGLPRGVGRGGVRVDHVTGLCPTCAERVPHPATD